MKNRGASLKFSDLSLNSGVRLHYGEQGSPSGSPVIFLHGYGDSWFSFSAVLAELPEKYHAFALDLRGYGDSDKPQGGYAMSDFAADVAAFMEAMDLSGAVLVGHSMGTFIARQAALAALKRTAGLVLIASALNPVNEGVLALQQSLSTLADPVPADFAREFQSGGNYQPLPAGFMERVVAESVKAPAHVWRAALAGLLAADDAADLGRLNRPVLVLWGDKDAVFPRSEQDALLTALPDARLKVYPDTGHSLPWERPKEVSQDIARFLERLDKERTIDR